MKVRMVLITAVAVTVVVGGIGYGAFRVMKGQAKPVEVVPVANVNSMYYGESSSMSGIITSQVAQTVALNPDYEIEEIFVEAGDTVKEGTPLFSYDMTLPELELEMDELTLQMYELNVTRVEKELEKLRGTPATASLEQKGFTMTASGENPTEEQVLDAEGSPQMGDSDMPSGQDAADPQGEGDGLSLVGIEQVTEPADVGELADLAMSGEKETGEPRETAGAEEPRDDAQGIQPQAQEAVTALDKAGQFLQLTGDLASIYGEDASEEGMAEEANAKKLGQALALRDEMAELAEDGTYSLKESFEAELEAQVPAQAQEQPETVTEAQGQPEAAVAGETKAIAAEEARVRLLSYSTASGGPDMTIDALEEALNTGIESVGNYHVRYAVAMINQIQDMDSQAEGYAECVEAARKAYGSLNSYQKTLEQLKEPAARLEQAEADLELSERRDAMKSLVHSFEGLLLTLDDVIGSHGDILKAEDIAGPVTEAVATFWKEFADPTEDGGYELKASVRELLADTDTLTSLQNAARSLMGANVGEENTGSAGYYAQYVRLLIDGLSVSQEGLADRVKAAREEYGKLLPAARAVLEAEGYAGKLTEMEQFAAQTEPPTGETQPPTEPPTGETQPPTEPSTDEAQTSTEETEIPTEPESQTESDTDVSELPAESESQPESDSLEDLVAFINQFQALAAVTMESEIYLEDWRTAIEIFQMKLGELPEEFAGAEVNTMEQYRLKKMLEEHPELPVAGLADEYKALCLKYVSARILLVDPEGLDMTATDTYEKNLALLEEARTAYQQLGMVWALEVRESYILDACDTILKIQAVDETLEESEILIAIQEAWASYQILSEEGRVLVWNYPMLQELMYKYGLIQESESESEYWGGGGWGGGGWGGDPGSGYTAEELQEMIDSLESELKEYSLLVRETKLQVAQRQRVVDGKVVKSTLNGTVLSIGSEDGSSDDEYFARVASTEGLYAKGAMNELSLAKIKVGDTISGTCYANYSEFTGVVKEIAEYPDKSGSYYSFGSDNTNASYYQFLALIDNPEDVEEGEAELKLEAPKEDTSNAIYLEKFFVREENDGRTYVMKQGEDGLLTKQYVETGKTVWGSLIQIVGGVTLEDKLAFPYGNNVVEGAKTKEVDQLTYS